LVIRTIIRGSWLVMLATAGACASARSGAAVDPGTTSASVSAPFMLPVEDSVPTHGPSCASCASVGSMPTEVTSAIENRLVDLKQRGGVCSRYGEVLEKSYRSGRITIRPYMWRVGDRLTSGEAKPTGEMTLAREIDSLNVGLRSVDDLVWSMEHEAVHIAFNITTGVENGEDRANPYVRACRHEAASAEPRSR